jgi:hypothetical protein
MNSDEELQKRIETGNFASQDDIDAKSYQHVFDALKKEPGRSLSFGFADKVVNRILAQKQQKESSRDFWLFGVGIFLLLIAGIVSVAFVGFKMNVGLLRVIADYSGFIVLGLLLALIFNYLDKKLLVTKAAAM